MTSSRRSSAIFAAIIFFFRVHFFPKKYFSSKIKAIFCFSWSVPTLFTKIRVAPNKKSCFHCFRCFRCSQWSPAPSIACFFFFFFCSRHEKPFTVEEKELFHLWVVMHSAESDQEVLLMCAFLCSHDLRPMQRFCYARNFRSQFYT